MARMIGINGSFLSEADKNKIVVMAQQLGFSCQFFNGAIPVAAIEQCEVLFGSFPVDLLKQAKALKWLQCSFAGVDKIKDSGLFAKDEVLLTNAAGAYGLTISEHMICVLLMLMRRMPEYMEMMKNREWRQAGNVKSIYGSCITIVGMGDIGSNFGQRVKAMGAKVRGVRRTVKEKPQWADEVYTVEDLDKAISGADVVALCLPSTQDTQFIMNKERLQKMQEGSILINVGRGSAIDQEALYDALCNGPLGGAAIDVTVPEPLPTDHPLWQAKNLILTPHISGNMSLPKTCENVLQIFLENLKRYAKKEELTHLVDKKLGY